MIKIKGTVKWFNVGKGFGFIAGEDDKEYFVHVSSVPEGVILEQGEEVTFDPSSSEKGMQARNVQSTK